VAQASKVNRVDDKLEMAALAGHTSWECSSLVGKEEYHQEVMLVFKSPRCEREGSW
jgi:hypothetical protein